MAIEKLDVGTDRSTEKQVAETLLEKIDSAASIADVKVILKEIVSQ